MSDWGWPTCWICHKEYEPLTGDGDGACHACYYGIKEDAEEKTPKPSAKLEEISSKVKVMWTEWNEPE
jgi:hypothetical protein